jgi:hypothetical protein
VQHQALAGQDQCIYTVTSLLGYTPLEEQVFFVSMEPGWSSSAALLHRMRQAQVLLQATKHSKKVKDVAPTDALPVYMNYQLRPNHLVQLSFTSESVFVDFGSKSSFTSRAESVFRNVW